MEGWNSFKGKNKKEVATAVGLTAAIAAGGAFDAATPSGAGKHSTPEKMKMEQSVNPADMQPGKGPEGATITINPEDGIAVVHMRPPGEGEVKNIDLHEEPVSIDLSQQSVTMEPPTNPDVLKQGGKLPNGGY